MRHTGRLLSVSESPVGTTLAADAAAGATSITVDDAAIFDVDGGSLLIGAQVVAYTTFDDETGVVTLSEALTDAADTDDDVSRWSTLYDEVETAQTAQVAVLGDRDQADTLSVEVADWVEIENGDRGKDGENCVIEQDGDVWTLIAAPGRPSKARGPRWEDDDPHTITAAEVSAGVVTHTLKHANVIARSMQVTWGRVQPPTAYSVDTDNGVLTYTLDGKEHVNDVLDLQYQYRLGLTQPRGTTVLVDWQATGWKHLQVASTDTTDRSGAGVDDSAWTTDPAAFARYLTGPHPYGYPTAATAWDAGTRMWLRRSVAVPSDALSVKVKIRVDDVADVYWSGTLLGTFTSVIGSATEHQVDVPAFTAGGTDVLAVRATDAPPGDPSTSTNWTYIDARVEATS